MSWHWYFVETNRGRCRSYYEPKLTKKWLWQECIGMKFRKRGRRDRRFAIVRTETGFEEATVAYRRYWPKDCDTAVHTAITGLYYDGCHPDHPNVYLYSFCLANYKSHSTTPAMSTLKKRMRRKLQASSVQAMKRIW